MTTREFIKSCSSEEFELWLKTACKYNSFSNIEKGKSFKTFVIHLEESGDISSIYLIQDRDNINLLHDALKYSDDNDFILNHNTMIFTFSYPEQLKDCKILGENMIKSTIKILQTK